MCGFIWSYKKGFEGINIDKSNKIIKKKREDLELSINLNGKDKILRIYVDSEYISIDNEKIKQLFEYFVFSNEVYLDKMYSDEYMTILNENNNIVYNFEKYSNEIPEKTWIIDDKKYGLLAILPKKFYKKYENKKYKLYESRLNNENYIDVWCDTAEYLKDKKQKSKNEPIIAILLILVGIFIVFTILLLLFYFGIDKLFSILNIS